MVWREIKAATGDPPCPRDKLCASTVGNKVMFFGGFGPLVESVDDEPDEDEAEFGWFNDLYCYDTGECAIDRHSYLERLNILVPPVQGLKYFCRPNTIS